MNLQRSPLWTDALSENRLTGTWRSAAPEYRDLPSPCLGACPVSGRIAEWIGQVENRDFHGAWRTLVDNNPFPAISGRICHHPCETSCNRAQLDETVSICALERFVGDMALAEGWAFPAPRTEQVQSVAVIGGGPAGLSAAYQLRRAGIAVTIHESREQLGGLLRYGIPAYRLDKAILDAEIARIIDMGVSVSVRLNAEIAGAEGLRQLRADHSAVFLATGASRPKPLPGLDYSQPWVHDSADFLATTNAGQACSPGGQFTADPVADSGFSLSADAIIPSIGQDADLTRWQDLLAGDGPVLGADASWRPAWTASSPWPSAWASKPRVRSSPMSRRTGPRRHPWLTPRRVFR